MTRHHGQITRKEMKEQVDLAIKILNSAKNKRDKVHILDKVSDAKLLLSDLLEGKL